MRIFVRCATALGAALLGACVQGGQGGGGGGGTNTAPVITSAANATADEGITAPAYRVTATDADGNTITFSITGGADAARFSISASTGDVTFLVPPDFEAPTDSNGDNVDQITVGASDGTAQATLTVSITVRDVVENAQVRRVATGFVEPVFVTGAGDNSGRLFVVQRTGQIRILNLGTGMVNATPFLDISGSISTAGERGLLGLAFAPNYSMSRVFYVYVGVASGATEIRRYTTPVGTPNVADAGSADLIYTFPRPGDSHVGGWIGFGNDNFLYIASGDSGEDQTSTNPAQNLNSPEGKILRIDVSGDDFPADANRDYRIPASNPFAGGGGLGEIYAYGLRNPFRASFDRTTGNLHIGDVGQGDREEIDLIPSGMGGMNFGWIRFEGTAVFNASASAPGAVAPVLEYLHGGGLFNGNSVTGGVVNRGPVGALQGHYIFGDFIGSDIWSTPATSLVLGATLTAGQYTRQTENFTPDVGDINLLVSFGTDDLGNIYLVDYGDGDVFRFEAM